MVYIYLSIHFIICCLIKQRYSRVESIVNLLYVHTQARDITRSHFHIVAIFPPSTVPFLSPCSEALASLKTVINKSKELKIAAVRPLVLVAEENLHNMVVDLDKVITQVRILFHTLCTTRLKVFIFGVLPLSFLLES